MKFPYAKAVAASAMMLFGYSADAALIHRTSHLTDSDTWRDLGIELGVTEYAVNYIVEYKIVVQEGDTLKSIAEEIEKIEGCEVSSQAIKEQNPRINSEKMEVGNELCLLMIREYKPERIARA